MPVSLPFPAFQKLRFGIFIHYVWGGDVAKVTIDAHGNYPPSLDDLADRFDAVGMAEDLHRWGAQYVIFTAWHANINPLFPSKTMKKWGLDAHCCRRDLVGDMIAAMKAKGIAVLLYTHPRDGHDLNAADQLKTGWNATIPHTGDPDMARFDRTKWNDFTMELYAETVDRYGKDIIGLYCDEGSARGDSQNVVDYPRLRQTIKSRNPGLVMIQNYYGTVYSCDLGDKEYFFWQEFESRDGKVWPAWNKPVATCFATQWFAKEPAGKYTPQFSVEDMFRYTVLQCSANTDGGGIQWATGPYPNGGWETGVDDVMTRLAALIRPRGAAITTAVPSDAYPTSQGTRIIDLTWGVATQSPDAQRHYLHVLIPPTGRSLALPPPQNGVRFTSARLLGSDHRVALSHDAGGVHLVLAPADTWDALDTVIELSAD